nr:acetyl-CoA carboxylase 1 [Tanacetum cinerariifolium]
AALLQGVNPVTKGKLVEELRRVLEFAYKPTQTVEILPAN